MIPVDVWGLAGGCMGQVAALSISSWAVAAIGTIVWCSSAGAWTQVNARLCFS